MHKLDQSRYRVCGWCLTILDSTKPRPAKVFCSIGCRDADALFEQLLSDEEVNLHAHYSKLTKGAAK